MTAPSTRFAAVAALLITLVTGAVVGPAVVRPDLAPAAEAAVHPTCTMSRCSAARTARNGWSELGYPTSRDWYAWPYGQDNFAGGRFYNREGELPSGVTYHEYDVYPRAR